MSALGHKRTFSEVCATSALPPKADMVGYRRMSGGLEHCNNFVMEKRPA